MAAIGDSFTAAFNAHPNDAVVPSPADLTACPDGLGPFGDPTALGLPASFGLDCPSNSWSTGTNPAVNSVYQRILANDPAILGHAANYAVTAVSTSDLPRQATLAASQGAQLVTVDIGSNDACAPLGSNGGQQTPISTFKAEFQQAMGILASAPSPRASSWPASSTSTGPGGCFTTTRMRSSAGHLGSSAPRYSPTPAPSRRLTSAPWRVSGADHRLQPDRARSLRSNAELPDGWRSTVRLAIQPQRDRRSPTLAA